MKTILITGANGYLASIVKDCNPDYEYILMTRKEADMSDPGQVEEYLKDKKFDVCFHTAANATTAICQENPELAHKINVESTMKIVDACKRNNARLIFPSSEQCLNGMVEKGPHKEDVPCKSVTVYGNNKLECEAYIMDNLRDFLIIRFSWMLGLSYPGVKASANIVSNVLNALINEKPTLFTVNENRSMTYAKKLAINFNKLLDIPTGIYNFASDNEGLSTYQLAVYVAEKLGANQEIINKIILPNNERYSDRFRDYRLDSTRLKTCGINLGTTKENIDECLRDFGYIK